MGTSHDFRKYKSSLNTIKTQFCLLESNRREKWLSLNYFWVVTWKWTETLGGQQDCSAAAGNPFKVSELLICKIIASGGRGLRFDSRNSFSKWVCGTCLSPASRKIIFYGVCVSIFCCENFPDLFVLVDLVLAPRPLVQHRALQPYSALPPLFHLQHTHTSY